MREAAAALGGAASTTISNEPPERCFAGDSMTADNKSYPLSVQVTADRALALRSGERKTDGLEERFASEVDMRAAALTCPRHVTPF
jgi:hypothetical protein